MPLVPVNKEWRKMRERIDASQLNINDRDYIYETPDHGKTIYRRTACTPSAYKGSIEFYDEVAGVRLDKHPDQMEFKFDNKDSQRTKKIEDVLDRLNAIEAQIREVRGAVLDLA
jgi:hypothetical protein